jgi:hypothetical protein
MKRFVILCVVALVALFAAASNVAAEEADAQLAGPGHGLLGYKKAFKKYFKEDSDEEECSSECEEDDCCKCFRGFELTAFGKSCRTTSGRRGYCVGKSTCKAKNRRDIDEDEDEVGDEDDE